MINFPQLSDNQRLIRLKPPTHKPRVIIDTDTYNEVDDQFAVVHALLSPDAMDVIGIHAAPFKNNRSESAEDGMEKSYDEILRLLEVMKHPSEGLVYKGSRAFLADASTPQESPSAQRLIDLAMAQDPDDDPLYVLAIGAITNVASAILMEPEIIRRIVVVWLGGHALHWHHVYEFNLQQDVHSARIVFDSGVPLIHIPCMGVASHLITTPAELNAFMRGKSQIGDVLVDIVENYHGDHYGWSKVIWDIATTAWIVNPDWVPTKRAYSPTITDNMTWGGVDPSRHVIQTANFVDRDVIFADLFRKLEHFGKQE